MLGKSIIIATGLVILSVSAAAAEEECRRYTQEIRAGNNSQNSYGMLCKQPDGTWKDVTPSSNDGYTYSTSQHNNSYAADLPNTHTHEFGDDYDTRVVIGDGAPYVVVDPFARYYRPNQRDWDNSKRSFYKTHHGPGWEKHWQAHKKVLDSANHK